MTNIENIQKHLFIQNKERNNNTTTRVINTVQSVMQINLCTSVNNIYTITQTEFVQKYYYYHYYYHILYYTK